MPSYTNVDLVLEVVDVVLNLTISGVHLVSLKLYVVANRVKTGNVVLGEQLVSIEQNFISSTCNQIKCCFSQIWRTKFTKSNR